MGSFLAVLYIAEQKDCTSPLYTAYVWGWPIVCFCNLLAIFRPHVHSDSTKTVYIYTTINIINNVIKNDVNVYALINIVIVLVNIIIVFQCICRHCFFECGKHFDNDPDSQQQNDTIK